MNFSPFISNKELLPVNWISVNNYTWKIINDSWGISLTESIGMRYLNSLTSSLKVLEL